MSEQTDIIFSQQFSLANSLSAAKLVVLAFFVFLKSSTFKCEKHMLGVDGGPKQREKAGVASCGNHLCLKHEKTFLVSVFSTVISVIRWRVLCKSLGPTLNFL